MYSKVLLCVCVCVCVCVYFNYKYPWPLKCACEIMNIFLVTGMELTAEKYDMFVENIGEKQ